MNVTNTISTHFRSPNLYEIRVNLSSGVSEEKMFKIVDGRRTTDGRRTPESLVYYKLTSEALARLS